MRLRDVEQNLTKRGVVEKSLKLPRVVYGCPLLRETRETALDLGGAKIPLLSRVFEYKL